MGYISQRLERAVFGDSDIRVAGQVRTLKGLREGDRTELMIGLAISALAWWRSSKPDKELVFRQSVAPGSALVIHHRRKGGPRIQVIEPVAGDEGAQTR